MIRNGALRLFRFAGVDIHIHWSWLIILYLRSTYSGDRYSTPAWIAAELAVYMAMILLQEGVQLAVGRLVGGVVSELYITFLGRPNNLDLPQRPWPIIITYSSGILMYAMMLGLTATLFYNASMHVRWGRDVALLCNWALIMNIILLIWTAAPVYPLEGGRVLQAFLWLFMSRKLSLQIACTLGLIGSLAVLGLGIYWQWWITVFAAVMMLLQCVNGFKQAKMFAFIESLPRRTDARCPHCQQFAPTMTALVCACGEQIDPFATRGICPSCHTATSILACPICGQRSAIAQWFGPTGMFEVQGATPAPVQPVALASAPVAPPPAKE